METHGLAAVDPVYRPWTYSMTFFFRKIIHKIWKIARPGNFTKTPSNFFEIIF
jgi:hypothetical protein